MLERILNLLKHSNPALLKQSVKLFTTPITASNNQFGNDHRLGISVPAFLFVFNSSFKAEATFEFFGYFLVLEDYFL